jgi:hypothetical protein
MLMAPAVSDVPQNFCASCGTSVAEGDLYCPNCGVKLGNWAQPGTASTAERRLRTPRRVPWKPITFTVIASLVIGGVAALVLTHDWGPEERIGSVTAPGLDPTLSGGGLSSQKLSPDVLVESLHSMQPVGYRILADAVDEPSIDDFREVEPSRGASSEFDINGDGLTLRFSDGKRFVLHFPSTQQDSANAIFSIAERYRFFSDETLSAANELDDRTFALSDDLNSRSLTIGVSEPDLTERAATLASDWEDWINLHGDNPIEARTAEAERTVVLRVLDVAESPTNTGITAYNDSIDAMNRALHAY